MPLAAQFLVHLIILKKKLLSNLDELHVGVGVLFFSTSVDKSILLALVAKK